MNTEYQRRYPTFKGERFRKLLGGLMIPESIRVDIEEKD